MTIAGQDRDSSEMFDFGCLFEIVVCLSLAVVIMASDVTRKASEVDRSIFPDFFRVSTEFIELITDF